MTPQEAEGLHAVRPELKFYVHTDPRFVFLAGRPCPILGFDAKGLAVCTEYERRPYNCRRFGCFRPDPATEPFELEPVDLPNRRLGCANLSDRLGDRQVRRQYARMQRKAQQWALKHGWTQEDAPTAAGSNVVVYGLTRTPRPARS